ncbi:MAG TPA: hypothetical protein DCM40_13725 [Maribacter sp.]|nr:hypothetical protein [Maribacter sp.]
MVTLSGEGISTIDKQTSSSGSVSSFSLDINDSSQNYALTYVYATGVTASSSTYPIIEMDGDGGQLIANWSLSYSGSSTVYNDDNSSIMRLQPHTGGYTFTSWMTIKMGYWPQLNSSNYEDVHLAAHTIGYDSGGTSSLSILNAYFPDDDGGPKTLKFNATSGSSFGNITITRAASWGMMGK